MPQGAPQVPPLRSFGAPVGMTRGRAVTFRKACDLDGQSGARLLRKDCRSLPLVGMTRRGWIRSATIAIWMDRVSTG